MEKSTEKVTEKPVNKKKPMRFYKFVTGTLGGLLKLAFRVKVVCRDNSKNLENTVICSNHMSNWDPIILACMLKSPISFMAKEELFRYFGLRGLLKALGVFPIKRGAGDMGAIRLTMGLLRDGNNIFMFPQGTRHAGVDPSRTEVKSGVSMLLNHSTASVLPVGIYTKSYKIRFLKKVYVVVGEPKKYTFADNSKEEYQRVSEEIFSEICTLCKNAENGEYDKKKKK